MHSRAIWNVLITLIAFGASEMEILKQSKTNISESLRDAKSSTMELIQEKNARRLYSDYYFNRNRFRMNCEMKFTEKIDKIGGQCICNQRLIKKYATRDVVRCFDSLSVQRQRQPMQIAFIGDSTIRQHFVSFLRLFPDHDSRITTQFNRFAYNNWTMQHHDDRNVTSQLLGNLRISFFWRNLINNELITDFERWASTDDDSQAPDYIFLGLTVHHLLENDLATFTELLETRLVPLINKSLAKHRHQRVVWLRLHTAIDQFYQYYGDFYTETVTIYNEAIERILKSTKIILWDSIIAIVEEYLRACALTAYTRHDFDQVLIDKWMDRGYMNCNDFVHPGMTAIAIGTQLILNHMCETVA
ncbi:hypothetical protein GHT06_014545 [Daphnia sinensis]|uniref:SGNH/GDSL hydrolase family protein n=1 Tax=Daphnia sinensis TaxID=1820382 RepID=A0AAD5KQ24_9CRUS|nr:hypothetical protein GHT06_014545 [Daphnia sinensis]